MTSELTPTDVSQRARFDSLMKLRSETYGFATLKTVLVKGQVKDEWRNSLTLVNLAHKGDPKEKDETFTYPNCILAKRTLSIKELVQIVGDILTSGVLRIEGLPETSVHGHFSPILMYEYVSSGDEIFKLEWPADRLVFEPTNKGGYPIEPFAAIDAPLFPGPYEVLRVWTGVDVSRYSQFIGTIILLLPDYSVRIDSLRLTSEGLTVKLQALETSLTDLTGKLYFEKFGEKVVQKDVTFETDSLTVPLGFIPDWWQFFVLSKRTKDILDYRKVHASWPSLPAGVSVEVGPADLEEMIRRGENDQVEFKQELSHKTDEFLESVVSFANSTGGIILVGVDKNGNVLGLFDQKFDERVTSMVRDNCEPAPEIKIEKTELRSKTIFVVNVPEGKDKPYILRNRGVYVRANSTDRLVSRLELDQMYSKKNQPLGTWLR